jgi:hypothetical protein
MAASRIAPTEIEAACRIFPVGEVLGLDQFAHWIIAMDQQWAAHQREQRKVKAS